jgi:hypothetical protein
MLLLVWVESDIGQGRRFRQDPVFPTRIDLSIVFGCCRLVL